MCFKQRSIILDVPPSHALLCVCSLSPSPLTVDSVDLDSLTTDQGYAIVSPIKRYTPLILTSPRSLLGRYFHWSIRVCTHWRRCTGVSIIHRRQSTSRAWANRLKTYVPLTEMSSFMSCVMVCAQPGCPCGLHRLHDQRPVQTNLQLPGYGRPTLHLAYHMGLNIHMYI